MINSDSDMGSSRRSVKNDSEIVGTFCFVSTVHKASYNHPDFLIGSQLS